jgi:hypothetical protein
LVVLRVMIIGVGLGYLAAPIDIGKV